MFNTDFSQNALNEEHNGAHVEVQFALLKTTIKKCNQ